MAEKPVTRRVVENLCLGASNPVAQHTACPTPAGAALRREPDCFTDLSLSLLQAFGSLQIL